MKKNKAAEGTQKPKKPIYKKWWFWLILVLIVGAMGSDPETTDAPDGSSEPVSTSGVSPSETTQPAEETTVPATEEAMTYPTVQTWGEGMYKVGTDIPAGEYYVTSTEYFGAYVEVAKDSSGEFDSIVANDNVYTFTFITVSEGQYLTVTAGEFVKAEDAAVPGADLNDAYLPGTYRVGIDIPAGEYKVTCTNNVSAYVEVAKDSTHALSSIVANDNVETSSYITVKDGQYLKVTGGEFSPA